MKILRSKIDKSVNFITEYGKSFVESRYVRRSPSYISAYLSSHNGCNMGCKFCWLTNSGQTNFNHVNISSYAEQLRNVLEHAKGVDGENSKNVRVNVNMMARGEPLANKYLINDYGFFYNSLQNIVDFYGYSRLKINISTIMPHTVKDRELIDIFGQYPTYLYYSLYSIDEDFRKKWIKNGIDYKLALDKLKRYQFYTNSPITLHFCIIKGENDNLDDVKMMAEEISGYKFSKLKFNLVKFNPHPSMSEYTEPEPEHIDKIFEILRSVSNDREIETNKSRIVPRAGPDVYASCGMFLEKS